MGAVHGVFSGPLSVGRDRPLTARTEGHSGIMPERLSAGTAIVQPDEERLAGRECDLVDPDGNRLRVATRRG